MKNFVRMVMAAALTATAVSAQTDWSTRADTSWYADNKTADEFTISAAEQLAGLAALVNGGNPMSGKTIKLGGNIALNDTAGWQNWADDAPANSWTAIGTYPISSGYEYNNTYKYTNRRFGGTFDGAGHTISGVYINRTDTTKDDSYQGLFGYVDSTGAIKNLGVTASYVKGYNYVGGLIGYVQNATVTDCYSTGNTVGNNYVGGLLGYVYIIEKKKTTITNSYAIGNVTGNKYVGGLLGSVYSSYYGTYSYLGEITNCFAKGTVTGDETVGGLLGEINAGSCQVTSCYATGNVSGGGAVGGFCGAAAAIINSCYATGNVLNDIGARGGMVVGHTGGLVGSLYGRSITKCYATGEVNGKGYAGGLIGDQSKGSISDCYATGNVTGTSRAGGLAGSITEYISNCYAIGSVSGTGLLAGLVPYSYRTGGVSKCYYNKETTGQADTGNGTPKTTAEMKQKATYVDWNFSDTWIIDTKNSGYPYLRWQNAVSVLSSDRIIPNAASNREITAVTPVPALTAEFAAGPNPVGKSSGAVNFFRSGAAIKSASLSVYDASGNAVRKIAINDNGVVGVRRSVGSWDLRDAKGRAVSAGTYLVRGAVVGKDGKSETVSLVVGVK